MRRVMLQTPRRRSVPAPPEPMRPARILLPLLLLAAPGGCASSGTAAGGLPAEALAPSLQTSVGADSVRFSLQLLNTGSRPVVLVPGGQPAYSFEVSRTGIVLWSSAAERAPTDWLAADTIEPGNARTFRASWRPPVGITGDLRATATVRVQGEPIMIRGTFRIQ